MINVVDCFHFLRMAKEAKKGLFFVTTRVNMRLGELNVLIIYLGARDC